jgi:hypothetical protein
MNSESDSIINSITSELHPETQMDNNSNSSFSWFNTFFLFLGFVFIIFIGFNFYLYFIEKKDKEQKQQLKENTLEKTLNEPLPSAPLYNTDEATSVIQSGGTKAGWCFIGEDRAFRSCAYVNETDQCMSGNIFPSKDICINPTLR